MTANTTINAINDKNDNKTNNEKKLSWASHKHLCDSDKFEQLCEQSGPSDMYFSVYDAYDHKEMITCVAITPVEYFDTHGHMAPLTPFIDAIPSDYGDLREGVLETEKSVEEARKELLALGFRENTNITDHGETPITPCVYCNGKNDNSENEMKTILNKKGKSGKEETDD